MSTPNHDDRGRFQPGNRAASVAGKHNRAERQHARLAMRAAQTLGTIMEDAAAPAAVRLQAALAVIELAYPEMVHSIFHERYGSTFCPPTTEAS